MRSHSKRILGSRFGGNCFPRTSRKRLANPMNFPSKGGSFSNYRRFNTLHGQPGQRNGRAIALDLADTPIRQSAVACSEVVAKLLTSRPGFLPVGKK